MFGWLNVDKPAGVTSRQVVNVVDRLLGTVKTGHGGTLDPLATGVLVVAVGPATRLIRFIQQMPKHYRATFRFGWESDTDDLEGQLQPVEGSLPDREELEAACQQFVGRVQQVPPKFSAVKIQGQRAYRLARHGEPIELTPRWVEIYRIELREYVPPDWTVDIRCGQGTYVRSLGRDIARRLGTGAVMTQLRRLAIGPFTTDTAVGLHELQDRAAVERHLIPARVALAHVPSVTLDAEQVRALRFGQFITCPGTADTNRQILGVDVRGELVAVLERWGRSKWRPVMCFVS